jgi:hypothetical protein
VVRGGKGVMSTVYMISPGMLGSSATHDTTHQVVSVLRKRGYEVQYCPDNGRLNLWYSGPQIPSYAISEALVEVLRYREIKDKIELTISKRIIKQKSEPNPEEKQKSQSIKKEIFKSQSPKLKMKIITVGQTATTSTLPPMKPARYDFMWRSWEAAEAWDVLEYKVLEYARAGLIPGAKRISGLGWLIPKDMPKPEKLHSKKG